MINNEINSSVKVTIIMATYNRAKYIVDALLSIQNQIFKEFECLVIDDGGNDNTLEVITPILNSDPRFKFFKRTDDYKKGLPGARNFGLDMAKGNYIIFFDDDDIVHPQLLSISVEAIHNYDFVHFHKKPFTDITPSFEDQLILINKSISLENLYEILTNKIGLASCTVLWDKKVFKSNRFNESLLYAEEAELYSRIISQNFIGVEISNTLYFNRKHDNSNTSEFRNQNPTRLNSKVDSICLIIENLKRNGLLSDEIIKYYIIYSRKITSINLTAIIIDKVSSNKIDYLKWNLYAFYIITKFKLFNLKKAIC